MHTHPLSLIVLPLAFALAAIFAAAAAYDFTTFRRRRKTGKRAVYRCDACRHIYTVPHRTPLARCPQCGKQNAPVRE